MTSSGWLSIVLCFGAIAIGIIALTGYVLGNASIASIGAGKPVSGVTALVFILLGSGLLVLRSPDPASVATARRAGLGVVVIAAADLLSAVLSTHIEAWQVWDARGGVAINPYPVTAILLLALGAALFFVTTRGNFAGHVIASTVLLTSVVFLSAYLLRIQVVLDPLRRVAPVIATTLGLALISGAALLARPRGWVVPLLSRTSTGVMTRVLLLATFIVPCLAIAFRDLLGQLHWVPEVGLAVVVDVVEVFFSAAVILGVGVILHKRDSDRARLAAIVDSSDEAIIGKSSSGLIESWNAGAERMYGYTAAEAIGRSVTMLVPPEQPDEVPLLLERIRRGEHIDPLETVRVAKDGRRIDVRLTFSPILDDNGNVVGASSIAHDITDRKKGEEEIRRQAEQYATLLATTTDGFWLFDREGRLLDVNDAYCRISGYSREELLRLSIRDLDAVETPEDTASRLRSISESGFSRFETKHRTKDNRILDIEGTVSVWRTTGQFLAFVRDITKRVEIDEALRESETLLGEAQQIANIGSAIVYPETGEIQASEEYFRIFDLEPKAGTPIVAFLNRVHEEDRRRVQAALKAAISSGTFDSEFRITCSDGSTRFAHGIARRRGGNARMHGLLGTVEDVTDNRQNQETLRRQNESLEGSNLELERFNRLAVGRELRMIELKRQVNDLCMQLGQPPPYVLAEERARALETS